MTALLSIDRDDYHSDEELEFAFWLLDLESLGLISRLNYEPRTYILSEKKTIAYKKQLKTKQKNMVKVLLAAHVYTPDFEFWIEDDRLKPCFMSSSFLNTRKIIVDVKGVYHRFGTPKQFSINQKWVFDNHGYYVDKVIPFKIFQKTFVPERCKYTKVKKDVQSRYLKTPDLRQFLKNMRDPIYLKKVWKV